MDESRTPSASSIARRVVVSGLVQGVGFRWHTRERARSLKVRGWVRNLPDGRVEVHAEGASEGVDALLLWLAKGPRMAQVEHLDVQPAVLEEPDAFQVRHD